MEQKLLRKLQMTELDIMLIIDGFCRCHGIDYSLYAGTALGAVRHGGFIPWDDDIDICMSRSDYNKFIRLWRENPVEGYTLAADDEAGCTINHSKILKNGTILSSKADMEKPIHHGVWVDLFAFDKVPRDEKKRKKFLLKAKLRLVYTRNYPYKNGGKLLEIASKILLTKTEKRKEKIKRKLNEYVQKYKDAESDYVYMALSCPESLKFVYPAEILSFKKIDFENHSLSIVEKFDLMLSILFGDYMTLPPQNERVCKHNPEIVKLDE